MPPVLRAMRAGKLLSSCSGFVLSFAAAFLLGACGQGAQEPSKGPPGGMALPVTVIKVAPQRVPALTEAVGQTEGSREVEIRARVSGILQKRLYQEGETVLAGAELFQIERAPYALQAKESGSSSVG